MSLFSKKQPAPVPEINYDEVVDYLRDLEQPDYAKILKVVATYRDADKKVKKILNIRDLPVAASFNGVLLLDDDDTELGNFLDDEPPKPKPKKAAKKK